MDANLRTQILGLIQAGSTLTLATMREDGWPQATTVAYANVGLTLFVATGADAQKVRNIQYCPKVSLTINSNALEWSTLQGLSMSAVADVIESASDRQQAARLIKKKFPSLADVGDPEHQTGWALLRIVPRMICVIDYTKGFGHTLLVPVS